MNHPPIHRFRTLIALYLMCVPVFGVLSPAQAEPIPPPAKTMRQIEAVEAEKAARTPAQQRLDSQLWYTLKMSRGEEIADGVPTLRTRVAVDAAGMTLVDIDADVTPVLLREITQFGGRIVSEFPQYQSIRADVPLASLETLAGLPGVKFVKPPVQAMISDAGSSRRPLPQQFADRFLLPSIPRISNEEARAARVKTQLTGALSRLGEETAPAAPNLVSDTAPTVDPEGNAVLAANQARNVFQVDGTGVAVGVLSNGVDSLATAQSAGALGSVTVLSGQAGSGDEGTAMLEIVHALAPGAKLYYATGFGSEAQFAANIVDLQHAGCNIIVDDVSYPDESPFQDGVIAQAVNTVTAAGAMYFSSAGNAGNVPSGQSSVWEGDFVDSGDVLNDGRGGAVHDFGGGVFDPINDPHDVGQSAGGLFCYLFWSDPLGGASDDYDLYDYDFSGDLLSSSTNTQNGTQNPVEAIPVDYDGNNQDQVLIVLYSGSARFLHIDVSANGADTGELSYYWTSGRTRGHNAGLYTIGVAAADSAQANPNVFTSSANVEPFSSEGERRIFFKPNGAPITPGNFSSTGGFVVDNPDITAADDVTTTVPGFMPFFGTSAAAPHAAAVAALVKSYNLALTPAQVKAALDTTATDIWTSGFDTISGNGIVQAFDAVNSVAASIEKLAFAPVAVTGGMNTTGTVTFSQKTTKQTVLSFTSSDPNAVVPAPITVPAGQTEVMFTVKTKAVSTQKAATITVSQSDVNVITDTATLTINPPQVASLALSPATAISGATATGTVTLNGAAPSGGATVTLTSSDTAAATVPASIVVPAGADTATFTATTKSVTATATVTVTATLSGSDKTATLTVDPLAVMSLALNPTTVLNGNTVTGTVTLNSDAPSGGTVVTLSSNNAAATVPASVTIIADTNSATFTVTTHSVTANTSVTVTSGLNGSSKTATLTVQPLELEALSISPDEVTGGSRATGTVTLNGDAGAEGTVVTLTTENSAEASVPASVTVPAGSSTATFAVTTHAVSMDDDVTITAAAGGVSKMEMLTVDAPGVSNLTLSPTTVVGGASSTGTVTIDSSAPVGGFPITLSSSNTSAATVPANVTISQNTTTATFPVTTHAVAASTSVTIKASTTRAFFTAGLTVTPSGNAAPTVTSFTPTSGPIGTVVTVTGTHLSGVTAVRFHNANASVFSANAAGTQLTVTVPTGAGTGTFTVTTPGGSVKTTGTFTVLLPPTVMSFTPISGSVGTVITVMGANLNGVTAVRFHNANAKTFSADASGTTLTVTVPTGAATGTFTVTTPGGSVKTTGTFTVN